MKVLKYSTIVFALLLCINLYAAGSNNNDLLRKKYDSAEVFLNSKNYSQALIKYLQIDAELKNNFNIKYKIGVCYLDVSAEKAIPYFEQASNNITKKYLGTFEDKYPPYELFKLLGQAYHFNYKFTEAAEAYESYRSYLNASSDIASVKETSRQIEICKNAKELSDVPVSVKIENMGANVNSAYADYSPLLSADETTLIFTSTRDNTTGRKIDPKTGKYYEDIYSTTKSENGWSAPSALGSPINTDGNEAAASLSIDGEKLIIYKDENGDGNLYTTHLQGNTWGYPQKLNDFINSKADETNASLSADGSALYFSSNREGGYGGKDIYKSKKLPNGEWGRPVNLGSTVNTVYDEDTPYIHPDGITLFFSSKGHKNMGGYDIFFTMHLSDTSGWMGPMNMGYPINTPVDDLFFVPTVGNKRAYYSSVKKDGFGDRDLYVINFIDQRETPLTVYKGIITSPDGTVPEGAGITVSNTETNDIIGEYSPNASTGKYLFILTPGSTYIISYTIDGDEKKTETIAVSNESAYSLTNRAIELKPVILLNKK